MKLKNGAKIIKSKPTYDGEGFVVLAKLKGRYNQVGYVTWIADKNGNCFHGHYFGEGASAAIEDYKKRS